MASFILDTKACSIFSLSKLLNSSKKKNIYSSLIAPSNFTLSSFSLSQKRILFNSSPVELNLKKSHSVHCIKMSSSFNFDVPPARRDETVVDDYHGVEIHDPYRWLEDPDAKETIEFVSSQNKLTESILSQCPNRENFKERMTELYNFPRYGCPFRRGDRVFYLHNSGLQAQNVLYMQDSMDSEAEVLLDPNLLSEDGTVALSNYAFSKDAKLLAYGCSESGSDWQKIKVMNVYDKSHTMDLLKWVKFSSIAWTHDHKGFFYCRYPEPSNGDNMDAGTETDINLNQKLYYHFVDQSQSQSQDEDILCWQDSENPSWMFSAEISDDGKYLILSIASGCDPVNRLYFCEIANAEKQIKQIKENKKNNKRKENNNNNNNKDDNSDKETIELLPFIKLVDNFDAQYDYITNNDSVFYFHTNIDSPKYKITKVDINHPEEWMDVIKEDEKDVLESVYCVNENKLVVCYLHDVKNVLKIYDLDSGDLISTVDLDIGSISSLTGRREDKDFFFSFSNFLTPGIIYRCDLSKTNFKSEIFRETKVRGFDSDAYETKQVFVDSKDNAKIPMFIVTKKNFSHDANTATLLYGYGGFNISLKPSFSVFRIMLLKHYGFSIAVANIRGGGEYGEEWHKDGSLENKQNVFDDFQNCAEYLINEKYSSSDKLCIEGGSNGGLLVAACINQRPDLFGCAISHVGVMDMLRFHMFTIGHAWTTDYGCSNDAKQFEWLIKYSPLHNVSRPWEKVNGSQYPPTMLLTADHDDRVVPLHSLKLIATLQHHLFHSVEDGSKHQTNPIIARIDTKGGHGAGRPTKKIIEESADIAAFMAQCTNSNWIN